MLNDEDELDMSSTLKPLNVTLITTHTLGRLLIR